MTNKVGFDVKATFDGSDVTSNIQRLNKAAADLAKQVAGVKVSPVDPAAFQDLAKLQQQMAQLKANSEQMLKVLPGQIRKRISDTGQSGAKDFFQVDWSKIFIDAGVRGRQLKQYYEHIFRDTGFSPLSFPHAAGGSQSSPSKPSLPEPKTRPREERQPEIVSIISSAGQAGLSAAGPAGHVLSDALRRAKAANTAAKQGDGNAPMLAGLGAGLGGLVGGLAALGVGKLVGGVMNQVGRAEQEAIGIDTLKRNMGDLGVDFTALRDRVRIAAEETKTSYDEMGKAASEFVHLSGMSAKNQGELIGELKNSVGFARSLGLEISQSAELFGTARKFGVTRSEGDSKRLAMMIGESVAGSGVIGKTDEVVSALMSFMASQARQSLAPANASGYLSALSGLMGSKQPGLDPAGSASMLAQINSAISRGGLAGEASQNFSMFSLSRGGLLNPFETQALMEQGAFGSGASAFGPDSVYAKFRRKFGGRQAPGIDGRSNFEVQLQQLQKDYAGADPGMMADALSRHLGLSMTQAMALMTFGPQGTGKVEAMLKNAGMSLGDVSGTSISALSQIATGGKGALMAQANTLLGGNRLSVNEASSLQALMKDPSKSGALEQLVVQLTAKYGQDQTEGSKTRDSIVSVDNTLQKLASNLLGPINTMRDAMVFLAGGGKMSSAQITEHMARLELSSKYKAADNTYGAGMAALTKERNEADAELQSAKQGVTEAGRAYSIARQTGDSAGMATADAALKRAQARAKAAQERVVALRDGSREKALLSARKAAHGALDAEVGARVAIASGELPSTPTVAPAGGSSYSGVLTGDAAPVTNTNYGTIPADLRAQLAETDRLLGLPPGTSEAQMRVESGMNPNAVSKAGARGLAQIMPSTQRNLEKRVGRKLDPFNPNDAVLMHRMVMQENVGRFGNVDDALRAYNGGWDPSKWGNDETAAYAPKVARERAMLPAGGRGAGAGDQVVSVVLQGKLDVIDKSGRKVGSVDMPSTKVPVPSASRVGQ